MSEKFEIVTVQSEGFTLAQIIWRFLRQQPVGYLERVLAANPGISSYGSDLPVGTEIKLPIENITTSRTDDVVRLWD